MAQSAQHLILYTHRQPIIFIDGSNGTNDQVALACKAAISFFIAVCQHKYWSASLKFKGLKAEGDVTREAEASGEEAEAELMLIVLLSRTHHNEILPCWWWNKGPIYGFLLWKRIYREIHKYVQNWQWWSRVPKWRSRRWRRVWRYSRGWIR